MEKRKLKLSFVNNGEQFVMPTPTVLSYEQYIDEMAKVEKKKKKEDINKIANKLMLVNLLREVDKSVGLSNINKMHPLDFNILVNEMNNVYSEGRELDESEEDFQKSKS